MDDLASTIAPVVVGFPDQFDVSNAGDLAEQLRAAIAPGVSAVVADLTTTVFCDSAGSRIHQIADTTWSTMFPQGREIYYEGDNPTGFARLIQAEFGFRPDLDPHWGLEIDDDYPNFISYSFHCPPEHLDTIHGSGRFPMGS